MIPFAACYRNFLGHPIVICLDFSGTRKKPSLPLTF